MRAQLRPPPLLPLLLLAIALGSGWGAGLGVRAIPPVDTTHRASVGGLHLTGGAHPLGAMLAAADQAASFHELREPPARQRRNARSGAGRAPRVAVRTLTSEPARIRTLAWRLSGSDLRFALARHGAPTGGTSSLPPPVHA